MYNILPQMEIEILARYRIQQARKELGLTQKKAAERAGMPYQTWLNYEQGRVEITLPILRTIARALDKKPEYFVAADPDHKELSQEIAEGAQLLPDRDQQELLELIRIKARLGRIPSDATPEPVPKKQSRGN